MKGSQPGTLKEEKHLLWLNSIIKEFQKSLEEDFYGTCSKHLWLASLVASFLCLSCPVVIVQAIGCLMILCTSVLYDWYPIEVGSVFGFLLIAKLLVDNSSNIALHSSGFSSGTMIIAVYTIGLLLTVSGALFVAGPTILEWADCSDFEDPESYELCRLGSGWKWFQTSAFYLGTSLGDSEKIGNLYESYKSDPEPAASYVPDWDFNWRFSTIVQGHQSPLRSILIGGLIGCLASGSLLIKAGESSGLASLDMKRRPVEIIYDYSWYLTGLIPQLNKVEYCLSLPGLVYLLGLLLVRDIPGIFFTVLGMIPAFILCGVKCAAFETEQGVRLTVRTNKVQPTLRSPSQRFNCLREELITYGLFLSIIINLSDVYLFYELWPSLFIILFSWLSSGGNFEFYRSSPIVLAFIPFLVDGLIAPVFVIFGLFIVGSCLGQDFIARINNSWAHVELIDESTEIGSQDTMDHDDRERRRRSVSAGRRAERNRHPSNPRPDVFPAPAAPVPPQPP